jgi:hypothetical protein
MIKDPLKEDLLSNDYPATFVEPAVHKMTRDLDRRSEVKPLRVMSVPYVRGVSEKFEKD